MASRSGARANDAIVSTASLVIGVAAAHATRSEILVAGVTCLAAGALSMAAGEYVSVSSLVGRAVEFSRDRAIRNAAPLIADIEGHRAQRGHYPASLLSVWKDYSPSVIGIEKVHYEPAAARCNTLNRHACNRVCSVFVISLL